MTFKKQLSIVKEAGQDFEWYPTTNEILDAVVEDLSHLWECRYSDKKSEDHKIGRNVWYHSSSASLLDVGAGNGKALSHIKAKLNSKEEHLSPIGNCFAIEKSSALISLFPDEITLLGVDFWNTALYDKHASIIFSNPPYKEFVEWTVKLVLEAPADALIYLVLPERWRQNKKIEEAMKQRGGVALSIKETSFENSEDRAARAKVEVLRIHFQKPEIENDPFQQFFDKTFSYPEPQKKESQKEETFEGLVKATNLIEALCVLYERRLEHLQNSIHAVCNVPRDVLLEFEISKDSLVSSIRGKLQAARKEYWQRLFDGMESLYEKFTHKTRKQMVDLLNDKTGIDFNRENAYEVVIWAVKHANEYIDQQLIDTYEDLVEAANVENYVSNQRVLKWNRFMYHDGDENSHYKLKVGHRMVLQKVGGIGSYYSWEKGLCERAYQFLNDILVIARNLGFEVVRPLDMQQPREWQDSNSREFEYFSNDGLKVFMKVRAFKNGNMHIQFLPEFIHALNAQHGKLKGWLRDDAEAATELDIPIKEAAKWFNKEVKIVPELLLETKEDPEEFRLQAS